jgi:cytoskeletal protein RodZ
VSRRRVLLLGVVAVVVALDAILVWRLFGSNDAGKDSGGEPAGSTASSTSTNETDGSAASPSAATSNAPTATSNPPPTTSNPPTVTSSAPTAAPPTSQTDTTSGAHAPRIRLQARDKTVATLEILTLTGSYPGAAPGTSLRVQRREGVAWADFPLPTVVLPSGRFVAHVELGKVGANRLRVVAPTSGDRSNTVTIRVR